MRKRKTVDPCQTCFMHMERCICAFIPKLELKTKLSLVIHHRELKRTTNTGRLAVHALTNSQMIVRGKDRTRLDLTSILSPDYDTYVLQPSEDAIDIEDLKITKPVQLIVSDGNWRQASKLHARHPEIAHLKRIRISQKNVSKSHLRKEHFEEGFSTLEAIAITMGVLEGDSVKESLLKLYQAKLQATILGRGLTA
ncbi:MAG: tRNA-uridine aminocarboxypropyltransferase [Bdellovibrionota bacterium]